jgi:hypothetical protein
VVIPDIKLALPVRNFACLHIIYPFRFQTDQGMSIIQFVLPIPAGGSADSSTARLIEEVTDFKK